jgi:arylsulfatase A-like enzyme
MADEGIRFTSFYAAPFCGPSRAALMTGCYPPRVHLAFNHGPRSKTGIHPDEITIAEVLKQAGYVTMHIGKWHLGDHPRFLPTRHGFDRFFGLPYSNDMWPYHPQMPVTPSEDPRMVAARRRAAYTGFAGEGTYLPEDHVFSTPLPLMKDEQVVEENPDLSKLTQLYTDKAIEFITAHRDEPFFLYLAHAMPHVPLFVSSRFQGHSERGLYGDAIEEIDAGVGQILAHLKKLGIDEQTMVIFTSDNGPWLEYGVDGGSAGPLRGGKGSLWEGGMRVPAVVCWPGHIPAGQRTSAIAANMDLLPTLAGCAGVELPDDRLIDGRDLWPVLAGQADGGGPHDFFYYYGGGLPGSRVNPGAVRDQRWKLHLTTTDGKLEPLGLYDLVEDVSERFDRSEYYPELVERLLQQARSFNEQLHENSRPLGTL